jgi:hypothetical protein
VPDGKGGGEFVAVVVCPHERGRWAEGLLWLTMTDRSEAALKSETLIIWRMTGGCAHLLQCTHLLSRLRDAVASFNKA